MDEPLNQMSVRYLELQGRSVFMFVISCLGPNAACSRLPLLSAGKIMRRVLRKIAGDERDLGDISTLADSSVVEQLFQNRCRTAV